MRTHISYITLGENRGLKRIWIQGQRLRDSNIIAGQPVSIIADEAAQTVTITMSPDGDRIVGGWPVMEQKTGLRMLNTSKSRYYGA